MRADNQRLRSASGWILYGDIRNHHLIRLSDLYFVSEIGCYRKGVLCVYYESCGTIQIPIRYSSVGQLLII
jgi:hypothetical protein